MDTSLVVAGFASWHEGHVEARRILDRRPVLTAQVAVESYSVLTRLPPPHRAARDVVAAFLERRFPDPHLPLLAESSRSLLQAASESGIVGGAIYDAIIAIVAAGAGATILSRDRRAARTYELLGARFELVGA